MVKKILLVLSCVACLCSSCKKQTESKKDPMSFESMMGQDLPSWSFVKTKEDLDNLSFYKLLFEKDTRRSQDHQPIPKVCHFIWIGPKEFPMESIENVKSWIANNPDWTFKFWTDRNRALPHPDMQRVLVQDFTFTQLQDCYEASENYAEKADVLRYEILFQEGGVYVDHDIKCIKSFGALNDSYDLYCGLELPSQTPLSSSVHVTNNLIGAIPHHPILKQSIDWLHSNWKEIESLYPGKDRDAVINRVAHRSFFAFINSVRELAGRTTADKVFPAYYFNAPKDEEAIYARHLFAGTWFENESAFEKMTRQRLMYLSKKVNKILLVCAVLAALNVLMMGALMMTFIRRRSQKSKLETQ